MNTNSKNDFVCMSVCLGIIAIFMFAMGCNSEPVGDDSIRLRAFLEVTPPGDSWSVSDYPPAVKVTNVGPEAAEISVFRFTLVADDDVAMEVPENCGLMYEDDPGEMVLVVHCTGISLEQNEVLTMDFPITGPWHYLELTSIYAVTEDGKTVFNDISAAQPLMWFNQNY